MIFFPFYLNNFKTHINNLIYFYLWSECFIIEMLSLKYVLNYIYVL